MLDGVRRRVDAGTLGEEKDWLDDLDAVAPTAAGGGGGGGAGGGGVGGEVAKEAAMMVEAFLAIRRGEKSVAKDADEAWEEGGCEGGKTVRGEGCWNDCRAWWSSRMEEWSERTEGTDGERSWLVGLWCSLALAGLGWWFDDGSGWMRSGLSLRDGLDLRLGCCWCSTGCCGW